MINLKNLIDFLPFEFKEQDTYKVDGKGILERFLENGNSPNNSQR